jgi:ribosomal protein S14
MTSPAGLAPPPPLHPWRGGARCGRCGRTGHLIAGDGPTVCRICLLAWGHYTATILRGAVVHEVGGVQLRHASHETPLPGCPLCRAEQVRSAPSFDGWMRGRGA